MENKKGFLRSFVDGLFFNNPVLSLFLGLTLAVISTARVQAALAIGAIVVLVLLITNLILSLLRKNLSKVTAAVVAAIISAGLSTIAMILVGKFFGFLTQAESTKYSIALLPIIPFVAVTSLVVQKSEDILSRDFTDTLGDTLGSALGFFLVLVLISLIREVLASGAITFVKADTTVAQLTLWDASKFKIGMMGNTFGGLLLVGLFSGLHLAIISFIKKPAQKEEK